MPEEAWVRVQRRTFTGWVNQHLSRHEKATAANHGQPVVVQDLLRDFQDGTLLMYLCEVLAGAEKRLGQFYKHPKNRHFMVHNVQQAFRFIEGSGINTTGLSVEGVVDGREKHVLGLVWALIRKFQLANRLVVAPPTAATDQPLSQQQQPQPPRKQSQRAPRGPHSSMRAELVAWLANDVAEYAPVVQVSDLTSSFHSGLLLAAMVHRRRPDAVDWPGIQAMDTSLGRLEVAMDAATKHLGVPQLLEPYDIANACRDDEHSLMTYLSYFPMYDAEHSVERVPKQHDKASDASVRTSSSAGKQGRSRTRSSDSSGSQRVRALQSSYDALREQCDAMRQELQDERRTSAQLRREHTQQQAQLAKQLAGSEAESAKTAALVERLGRDKKRLEESISKLEASRSAASSEMQDMLAALERDVRQARADAEAQHGRAAADVEAAHAKAEQSSRELQRLAEDNARLRAQRKQLDAELRDAVQRLDAAKTGDRAHDERLQRLEARFAKQQQRHERELKEAAEHARQLERLVAEREADLAGVREENDAAHERIAQLEHLVQVERERGTISASGIERERDAALARVQVLEQQVKEEQAAVAEQEERVRGLVLAQQRQARQASVSGSQDDALAAERSVQASLKAELASLRVELQDAQMAADSNDVARRNILAALRETQERQLGAADEWERSLSELRREKEQVIAERRVEAERMQELLHEAQQRVDAAEAEAHEAESRAADLVERAAAATRATQQLATMKTEFQRFRHLLSFPQKSGGLALQDPGLFVSWKTRWFSLRNGFFMCFKDASAWKRGKPEFLLDLSQCSASAVPYAAIEKEHVFVINSHHVRGRGNGSGDGNRVLYMAASSPNELQDWVTQIRGSINYTNDCLAVSQRLMLLDVDVYGRRSDGAGSSRSHHSGYFDLRSSSRSRNKQRGFLRRSSSLSSRGSSSLPDECEDKYSPVVGSSDNGDDDNESSAPE